VKKLAIVGLLVVALTLSAAGAVGAAPPTLHKATGGGIVDLPIPGVMTTAFTAIQVDEQGNAKGQIQFVGHDTGAITHVAVVYLAVEGNNAWIGGVVTDSTAYPVGWGVVGWVQDNGEGSKATGPDKRSYFYLAGSINPFDARTYGYGDLFDWTNGNVQVK